MRKNETRRSVALYGLLPLAGTTTIGVLAMSGAAVPAIDATAGGSAGHALVLVAIAWFIASLRLRRRNGAWTASFQWSPLRDLPSLERVGCTGREGTRP